MDQSMDTRISTWLFGVENDLAPFYKSISCWALTCIWLAGIFSGFRKYAHWQATEHLFLFFMLLAVATAALGLLLLSRSYLSKHIEQHTVNDVVILKVLSSAHVRTTGLLLLIVLFVIGSC
ncbi:MAG TPA: hypothetical protein VKX41_18025 [Alloacidobacterium sp.]|jgi:hypothetical protein|nr:hypothetical protein [Alloacidobacterium sp.]